MKIRKFRLNVPMMGFPKGYIINLKFGVAGEPVDLYWNRRYKDSKYDNCMEEVVESRESKKIDKKIEKIVKTD